jgi:hypothetical protein
MSRMTNVLVAAAAVAALPGVVHAEDLQVTSAWASQPVQIDGHADEWGGHLLPLGDTAVLVGIENDADYLYLCIKSSDPGRKMQLGRFGLTVWADGRAKDDRGFGVHFPLGTAWRRHGADGEQQVPPADGGFEPGSQGAAKELELIGPTDKDRLRVPISPQEAVQAALGDDFGVTVLEMRIPLAPTDAHPLAIGTSAGATIAVGFETEMPKFNRGGGFHMGGWGGRGGGGWGGEGGGRGWDRDERSRSDAEREAAGGRIKMPGRLKLWARVALAQGPAAPPSGR